MKFLRLLLFAVLINVLYSTQAYANLVWPSLYLAGRTITWAPILVGLIVEYLFIRKFTDLENDKAIYAVVTMNLTSALIGMYPIVFSGLFWEMHIGTYLNEMLNMGTFNPYTWTATIIMAVGINTLIEGLVLRWGYKLKNWKKTFIWLGCANSISVLVAYLTIYIKPPY
ncbi:hypothetical protein LCGC14_3076800 [marine sediment metagenome]|uniref:Uncharacterized protein n=1 Tax=marine sediment metagenome TaxID=412755 RepID=A0A0F8X2Y2_9ZZZZ